MNQRLYILILFSLVYLLIPFLFWEGFGVFELNLFAIGTYLISSISLGYLCSTKEIKTIASSFWIFVYIFLMIAPVAQQVAGYYPWPSFYQDYQLLYSWALVFFCNLSFLFFNSRTRIYTQKIFCYSFSEKKIYYFTLFAIISTFFSLVWIGGFSNLFLSRDDFSDLFNDNITTSMIVQAMFRNSFFCSIIVLPEIVFIFSDKH